MLNKIYELEHSEMFGNDCSKEYFTNGVVTELPRTVLLKS